MEVDKKTLYLAGLLPFFSKTVLSNKTTWRIFGIEILKKKIINNNKQKYYFLGIPVLKITAQYVKNEDSK